MNDFVVYVVDDDEEVAASIALLMSSVGLNAKVFSSAQAFLSDHDPDKPGCLILDVRMPGMSGPEMQSILIRDQVQIPIIFITGHGDIPTAVRVMKNGALDLLEKPFNDQALLDRVYAAREQDKASRLARSQARAVAEKMATLTARERQVLEKITEGSLNKLIASDLGLSIRTIELHRANIMKKLQAKSVAELVRMTLQLQENSSKND